MNPTLKISFSDIVTLLLFLMALAATIISIAAGITAFICVTILLLSHHIFKKEEGQ